MEVLEYLESNKQYPTLVLEYEARKPHNTYQYRVTSVIALLDSLKFSRFPSKDKSDYTFIKICSSPDDNAKIAIFACYISFLSQKIIFLFVFIVFR